MRRPAGFPLRIALLCAAAAAWHTPALSQPAAPDLPPPGTAQRAPTQMAPTQMAPTPLSTSPLAPPHRAAADTAHSIALTAGTGRIITLGAAVANVFAADPKVAEVRPASPTTLFVFGVAPGATTIAALDAAGHAVAQYAVTVRPSAFSADEVSATIARQIPGSSVNVRATPTGLLLSGEVPTPAQADRAAEAAQAYLMPGQKLDNRLAVSAGMQVNLRVRIAEMSRTVIREFGINWNALGNLGRMGTINFLTANALGFNASGAASLTGANVGNTVNGVIDALAADNLIHVLAEPNLTTMSGETASFLVGGMFPIPMSQGLGAVSVQFQQYGVQLSFVPTVLSSGRISLHVRPEVSELTTQGAVQLSSGVGSGTFTIPALTVRRADTTVELGTGQSFAIAGLLQDSTNQADQGVPGLADLPILGALFRSTSFQRAETELVIVVTPYIVRPVSDPSAIRLPTDGWRMPNDIERIFLLRQTARTAPAAPLRVPGDAGFIVQ